MADNSTAPSGASVDQYLTQVEPEARRKDALALATVMQEATGELPRMWGESIVGFGEYHYVYASGREGDWMSVGFAVRKTQFALYGLKDHPDSRELLLQLGPHTERVGCLYIKRMADIDEDILRQLTRLACVRD